MSEIYFKLTTMRINEDEIFSFGLEEIQSLAIWSANIIVVPENEIITLMHNVSVVEFSTPDRVHLVGETAFFKKPPIMSKDALLVPILEPEPMRCFKYDYIFKELREIDLWVEKVYNAFSAYRQFRNL